MATTKVNITLSPEEHRTMVEHLTEARTAQARKARRDSDATPHERQRAETEVRKLNSLLENL